jgi:thiosulfate dehydrogenase (quinone) large subunit
MKKPPTRSPQPQPRRRIVESAPVEPKRIVESAPVEPISSSPVFTSRLASWSAITVPAWVALPLRLFLGVTFAYAGIQKLTDPGYFRPSAPSYIGRQLLGFSHGTPLGGLLLHLAVPHATLFGGLIAWGELAIGLGVLIGVLVRPAAFFGALLSLIFFLTASWRVYPYFYGSDIVFLFGWTVVILAGPSAGGWPVFDAGLASWLLASVPRPYSRDAARVVWIALGVPNPSDPPTSFERRAPVAAASQRRGTPVGRSMQVRGGRGAIYARAQSRRDFFRGLISGAAGALGAVFMISLLRSAAGDTSGGNVPPSSGSSGVASNTPGTGGTVTIAEVSQVPANNSVSFTAPSSGDPGVLVHLPSGDFVAFDALCTHAGCAVQYDPSSRLLLCPCHGAAFDPAHGASVVQGPAPTPLTSIPVTVNQATGAITTTG